MSFLYLARSISIVDIKFLWVICIQITVFKEGFELTELGSGPVGFDSQGPCVSMPSCGNAETARTLGARFASELFNPQRAVQTLSSQNKVGMIGGVKRRCRNQDGLIMGEII